MLLLYPPASKVNSRSAGAELLKPIGLALCTALHPISRGGLRRVAIDSFNLMILASHNLQVLLCGTLLTEAVRQSNGRNGRLCRPLDYVD